MNIETYESRGVVVLDLDGDLLHGVGEVRFREAFEEALEAGHRKIVIDLDGVETIDSSGLGELVRAKITARRQEIEIKLANLNSKAYELLSMSKLLPAFDIHDSEDEAIDGFQ